MFSIFTITKQPSLFPILIVRSRCVELDCWDGSGKAIIAVKTMLFTSNKFNFSCYKTTKLISDFACWMSMCWAWLLGRKRRRWRRSYHHSWKGNVHWSLLQGNMTITQLHIGNISSDDRYSKNSIFPTVCLAVSSTHRFGLSMLPMCASFGLKLARREVDQ